MSPSMQVHLTIMNRAGTPVIVVLARLRKYKYVVELLERGATLTDSAARDLWYLIQKYPLAPAAPNYTSQLKTAQLLTQRGYPATVK